MLKRQRPVTPPPSSLGDPPSFLPNGLTRSLQPSHSVDPSERRFKRQRTRPPPLDGGQRGWLKSEPAGPHWESDGEEDWIEDAHEALGSHPPSTTANQYKDANSLLHELHVLNQPRLLFAHSSRDPHSNPNPRAPLNTVYAHLQDPPAGQRQAVRIDPLQLVRDRLAGHSCCVESVAEKGLVQEVQYVRQHYEDTNRFLGSLFLSRRREVKGMSSSDLRLSS